MSPTRPAFPLPLRLLIAASAALWAGCAFRPADSASSRARPEVVRADMDTGAVHERSGRLATDRTVRVALGGALDVLPVSATGAWTVDDEGGNRPFVRGKGSEAWRVERRGRLLRLAGPAGDNTPWRAGPFVARPAGTGVLLRVNGKRYRGEVVFTATDTGVLVVNRLPVEEYLRGVVPLELPTRQASDVAALEAQAIAARSYTYQRVPAASAPSTGWHVTATVQHQVYGGVEVEHPVVDAAIAATAGLVLQFGGRPVDAPYFASCGGRTAGPREAWHDGRDAAYLRSVDDTDPRTGRAYCNLSPRNQWTAEFDDTQLGEIVARALRAQGPLMRPAAGGGAGAPRLRAFTIGDRTPSGRASAIVLRTDAGEVTVSMRDIRPLLRDARGAALPSTYFSVVREARAGGRLSGLTLRGAGHGHGVGMCQWGAIGRARSGADARAILRHYYPGTVVGFAD